MNRRHFVRVVVGGVLCAPVAACTQKPPEVRRIGWLALDDAPTPDELKEMLAPLKQLGWTEGENLIVEGRYAYGRGERLRSLADQLVRLNIELIVTDGTDATLAAKSATHSIPIVMRSTGDPVSTGIVASLSKPGANITGYSIVSPAVDGKRLALLREMLPTAQRVAYLANSTNPYYRSARKDVEQTSASLGFQLIFVEVAAASELEKAFEEIHQQEAQALVIPNDNLFTTMNRVSLMTIVLRYALPSIGAGSNMLKAGTLLSFNQSMSELRRRGAAFIDKILRGAKPADLPIEQPTQFELGINLKTATILGITVPQSLLSRADEVIR